MNLKVKKTILDFGQVMHISFPLIPFTAIINTAPCLHNLGRAGGHHKKFLIIVRDYNIQDSRFMLFSYGSGADYHFDGQTPLILWNKQIYTNFVIFVYINLLS